MISVLRPVRSCASEPESGSPQSVSGSGHRVTMATATATLDLGGHTCDSGRLNATTLGTRG